MPPKKKKKDQIIKIEKYKPINFYELPAIKSKMVTVRNPNFHKHNINQYFNMLIIGSTGAGKTNILANLIYNMGNTFNHIFIFTKRTEPIYDFLIESLPEDMITIKYGYQEFVNFDENKFEGSSLVIFDDFVAEKNQTAVSEHFIRGRKLSSVKGLGCSSIYLSQMYLRSPKQYAVKLIL